MSRRKNRHLSGRRPLPVLGRTGDPLHRSWKNGRPFARTCGDCRMCCFAPPVEEPGYLEKPAGVECAHLCEDGCALYGTPVRPRVCERFACNWLRGDGDPEQRPDLMGALPVIAADRAQCAFYLAPRLTPETMSGAARAYVRRWHRKRGTAVLVVHGESYGLTTALWPDGSTETKETTFTKGDS